LSREGAAHILPSSVVNDMLDIAASSRFPSPLGDAALADTWAEAWRELDRPVPLPLRLELQSAWSEEHRRYHDQSHLRECMALWSLWRDQCERPGEVAIALWFHDAVYDPTDSGNEIKSASWATRSLVAAGVDPETAQHVFELVMASRHNTPAQGADAQLLVDIDLAILGSPGARFERYDQDVRKEYAWMAGFRYRVQRAHVLKGFLNRVQLYHGAQARDLFESQARLNLTAAISRLQQ
jgi:predicted metal-dependent HD superfamily phosphohydrolase